MDRVGKIVNDIIRQNDKKSAAEVSLLIRRRFEPLGGVVLEEWFKEPLRREAMKRQTRRRRATKRWYRVKIQTGRRMRYHPTKGWRYA